MAAKVATAASSVAMSTAVRPMNRVVASGVMRVPSSDLEINHLGHDEGAYAHPHHAACARDHQARIGEEIGHIGLVDHPYHAEDDERQRTDDIGGRLGFRRHGLDLERSEERRVGKVCCSTGRFGWCT